MTNDPIGVDIATGKVVSKEVKHYPVKAFGFAPFDVHLKNGLIVKWLDITKQNLYVSTCQRAMYYHAGGFKLAEIVPHHTPVSSETLVSITLDISGSPVYSIESDWESIMKIDTQYEPKYISKKPAEIPKEHFDKAESGYNEYAKLYEAEFLSEEELEAYQKLVKANSMGYNYHIDESSTVSKTTIQVLKESMKSFSSASNSLIYSSHIGYSDSVTLKSLPFYEKSVLKDFIESEAGQIILSRGWLAGGSLRAFIEEDNTQQNDWDIYFPNAAQMESCKQRLVELGAEVMAVDANNKIICLIYEDYEIQLIGMKFFKTARDIWSDFDFINCCAATDGTRLIHHGSFIQVIQSRELWFNHINNNVVRTMERIIKYTNKYGYTIQDSELTRFLRHVQETDKPINAHEFSFPSYPN